jgi:hypothetical protein
MFDLAAHPMACLAGQAPSHLQPSRHCCPRTSRASSDVHLAFTGTGPRSAQWAELAAPVAIKRLQRVGPPPSTLLLLKAGASVAVAQIARARARAETNEAIRP